ncbi:hypothetical protein AACH06_08630 [Ideonella sp. DXS29W]|uniref:Uncharacterized protein n=1 Tax=Ideonella lacteola TaxID=2984193 RepID=A0ABU9BQG8_9BURK
MKTLIWAVAGLLALLWTGLSAAVAAVLGWAGGAMGGAESAAVASSSALASLPPWLAGRIDPSVWAAVADAVMQGLQAAQSMLPLLSGLTGLLVPLVWIVWAIGLAGLLGLSALATWLVARALRLPHPPMASHA